MSFFRNLFRGASRLLAPVASALLPVAKSVISKVPGIIGDVITGRPTSVLGAIKDIGTQVLGDVLKESQPVLQEQGQILIQNVVGQNPLLQRATQFIQSPMVQQGLNLLPSNPVTNALQSLGRMAMVPTFSSRQQTNVMAPVGVNQQYSRGGTSLNIPYGMTEFGSSGLSLPSQELSFGGFDNTGFGQQTNFAERPTQPQTFTPQAFASFNQQYVGPGGRTLNPPPQNPGQFNPNQLVSDF